MALNAGNAAATLGMARDIYDQMDNSLSPGIPPESLPDVREKWKLLAFAIATGVVTHLTGNLEISGATVEGAVSLAVSGSNAGGNVTLNQTGQSVVR